MHKLLAEQIKRYLGTFQEIPEEVRSLLRDVDRVYRQADLLGLDVEKLAATEPPPDQNNQLRDDKEKDPNRLRSPGNIWTSLDLKEELLGFSNPLDTACKAVENLVSMFALSGGAVTMTDFSTGEMVRHYQWGSEKHKETTGDRYFLDDDTRSRLRAGKLMLIDGQPGNKEQDVHNQGLQHDGHRSIMRVPVVVRDHLVAVLDLLSFEENAFHLDVMQAAQEAASQVTLAVQQAALLAEVTRLSETLETRIKERTAELERQAKDISLLNDMGELLQSCSHIEEAYDVIQNNMPRIFPDMHGALAMVAEDGEHFTFIRSWGLEIDPAEAFPIEDCWGLRRGQPHMVEADQGGLLCRHVEAIMDKYTRRTLMCIPLTSQSETGGFLHLRKEVAPGSREYGEQSGITLAVQQLALTVAEQVGLALANLNLQESLRIQAIRDPITGLYNRRYMEESLEREIQRSIRHGTHLGVIMLDIDHFKKFNDRYGHAVGDALLRELGPFLQEKVRKEDIACKYGGEEFVLILPNADLSITADRAETIRRAVKGLHVVVGDKTFENITLSLGVSIFPTHGRDREAVLKAADTALYMAKANGRDQVVVGGMAAGKGGRDRRN